MCSSLARLDKEIITIKSTIKQADFGGSTRKIYEKINIFVYIQYLRICTENQENVCYSLLTRWPGEPANLESSRNILVCIKSQVIS